MMIPLHRQKNQSTLNGALNETYFPDVPPKITPGELVVALFISPPTSINI